MKSSPCLLVSVVGIDGTGKSTAIKAALHHLKGLRVRVENIPLDPQKRDVFGRLDQLLERIWVWAGKHGNKFVPALIYTIATLLYRFKYLYRFHVLNEEPNVLITQRSLIIDSIVYLGFYWGAIERLLKVSLATKMRWAKRLTGQGLPDLLIFLEVDPKVSMVRIENHSQRVARQAHETEHTLIELRSVFRAVIAQAQEEKGSMQVFRLDTTDSSVDEVGLSIAQIIRSCL